MVKIVTIREAIEAALLEKNKFPKAIKVNITKAILPKLNCSL